jgi:hypothetical protein
MGSQALLHQLQGKPPGGDLRVHVIFWHGEVAREGKKR